MVSSSAQTVEQYLRELEHDKAVVVKQIRKLILENLPLGIVETMNWGMINYEIPLTTYPKTYNKKPLSVISLAAQKNYFALYLHGVYCDENLHKLFLKEAQKEVGKLDMGKSCLRFKKIDKIPQKSLKKIIQTVTPDLYIKCYEKFKM